MPTEADICIIYAELDDARAKLDNLRRLQAEVNGEVDALLTAEPDQAFGEEL